MRAKHACNSYKCITRLIVTGTRHHYAAWVWSCTNFVHGVQYAPIYYPDFGPRFTLSWISPLSRPRCTAHLPYKACCIIKQ